MTRALAPSHVCSRLHKLIARDDINCYIDLDWVTYDDLELVVIFLMIVIKPCDTSMPKQTLVCVDICVDMMVGLDVSHGSMYIMNFFLDDFLCCKFKIK